MSSSTSDTSQIRQKIPGNSPGEVPDGWRLLMQDEYRRPPADARYFEIGFWCMRSIPGTECHGRYSYITQCDVVKQKKTKWPKWDAICHEKK